ncbi:MAG: sigma-70 family RNA polymerase sigma factor [Planctomycetota bacterium]
MSKADDSFEQTARIIRRARDGDKEAMSAMVRRYQAPLMDRVRRAMGPVPREFAESMDVMQDLLLDLLKDFDGSGVEDEDAFLRWATRIVRNNIKDQMRKQRLRSMEALASSMSLQRKTGEGGDPRPSQAAAQRDEVDRLEQALSSLPEQYRQVIELRDLRQLSYREIAEIMNRPGEAAVQMLHARAFAKLTEKLT